MAGIIKTMGYGKKAQLPERRRQTWPTGFSRGKPDGGKFQPVASAARITPKFCNCSPSARPKWLRLAIARGYYASLSDVGRHMVKPLRRTFIELSKESLI